MRVIMLCLVLAAALASGACGRKVETVEASLADGPPARAVIAAGPVSQVGRVIEPAASKEAPSGETPIISARRSPNRAARTAAGTPSAARATTVLEPRVPTPAESAAAELDAWRLFRACMRLEADAATFAEVGRAYWRTQDGRAVLNRCGQWSGLGWPPQSWGGGSDNNPNEEEP
jgi:hypothetical protein